MEILIGLGLAFWLYTVFTSLPKHPKEKKFKPYTDTGIIETYKGMKAA